MPARRVQYLGLLGPCSGLRAMGACLGLVREGEGAGPARQGPPHSCLATVAKGPAFMEDREDPAVSRPLLRLRLVEEARDTKGGLALSIFECGWLGNCGNDVEVGLGCPGP